MDSAAIIIMNLAPFIVFGGVVGGILGSLRCNVGSGIVWGAILGPIGWLMVLVLMDRRPVCPHCRERVKPGAVICRYCQRPLEPLPPEAPGPLAPESESGA